MTWTAADDGCDLYWEQTGDGPDLVFVGGWTGMVEMWEPVIEVLANSHRCTAYDLRGNGRSDKPAHGCDVATHADDLVTLCQAAGVSEPVLVGHSMGAMITVEAVSRLGPVRGLVLTGAFPSGAQLLELAPFDLRGAIADAMPRVAPRVSFFVQSGATERVALETAKWPTKSLLDNAAAFLTADISATARTLDVPVLLIHGTGDVVAPLDPCATTLAQLVSDAVLERVEGGNHCVMLHRSSEFADAVSRFASERVNSP